MSLVIPDEFLQTAHISEADLKLEIAILPNISHGPRPDGCSITKNSPV
jgi:hypothetical protein